jgi:hypothetical protein
MSNFNKGAYLEVAGASPRPTILIENQSYADFNWARERSDSSPRPNCSEAATVTDSYKFAGKLAKAITL